MCFFNRLDELSKSEEHSGNTSGGNGVVGRGSTRRGGARAGARAGAGAGGGARLAVGGGGVIGGGLAVVGTADGVVVLQLLEVLAVEGAVGGLHVESTVNLIEGTHGETAGKKR